MQHSRWQKRSICLTFPSPATKFILLSSRRSSSLHPGVGGWRQCALCGLQIAGEAFRAWSRARLPKTHESPGFIYSAAGELRLEQRVISEYNPNGDNEADGLKIQACIFVSLDHKTM